MGGRLEAAKFSKDFRQMGGRLEAAKFSNVSAALVPYGYLSDEAVRPHWYPTGTCRMRPVRPHWYLRVPGG